MAKPRNNRMRNYELLEERAQQRRAYDQQSEDGQYLDRPRRNLGLNTMEAPEEVVARRTRYRVAIAEASARGTGNPLMENVLILVLLVLSIFGLYHLTIYLLSQAS